MATDRLIRADGYNSLQDAITDTGRKARAIFLPNGTYTIGSLDLTLCRDLLLVGESQSGVIIVSNSAGKAAIDLSGSSHIHFRNLTVRGSASTPPAVAFFQARSSSVGGELAGYCSFENVLVDGSFTLGAWLLFSAELNRWQSCKIQITPAANPRFGIYSAAVNTWSITSDYTTLSETVSNSTNWVNNLSCVVVGAEDFAGIWLGQGANGFTLRDSYLANTGLCNIRLSGDHYRTTLDNITCEQEVQDIIHIEAGTLRNTVIRSVGNAVYTRAAIYADDSTLVEDVMVDQMRGGASLSAMRFDDLRRAYLNHWYSVPGQGGFTANKVYHSDIVMPPSGKTISTQELYNTWRNRGGDGLTGNADEVGGAFILRSPNGKAYRLLVGDDGALSTVSVTP